MTTPPNVLLITADQCDPAARTYAGTLPGFTQLVPGSEGDGRPDRVPARAAISFPRLKSELL